MKKAVLLVVFHFMAIAFCFAQEDTAFAGFSFKDATQANAKTMITKGEYALIYWYANPFRDGMAEDSVCRDLGIMHLIIATGYFLPKDAEADSVHTFNTVMRAALDKKLGVEWHDKYQKLYSYYYSRLCTEGEPDEDAFMRSGITGDCIDLLFPFRKFALSEKQKCVMNYTELGIIKYLLENSPKMIIEIGGYQTYQEFLVDSSLAQKRALSVFKYLTNNGIPAGNLTIKSYGYKECYSAKDPKGPDCETRENRKVGFKIASFGNE